MSDRFPQMYTAEPDATGTAYDEINSLIYLDDVQNAPTAPEGSTLGLRGPQGCPQTSYSSHPYPVLPPPL